MRNGSPWHSWPRGGRQLSPGRGHFQRMENRPLPFALPSISSDEWTSVGNTAVGEPVGHNMAFAGTVHVKKDMNVEHGQQHV